MKFLNGYKTYILVAIACTLLLLQTNGVLEVPNEVYILLGGGSIAAMRAGMTSK